VVDVGQKCNGVDNLTDYDRERVLRVRDPIHGLVPYSEHEESVMNTPVFQRLRGIRQLALAELVYPGARHSRFEHSIGTMHVAGRLAVTLGMPDDEIDVVRLAALLHDVGHGPFSHLAEHCLDQFTDNELFTGQHQIHERISAQIIKEDKNLGRALAPDMVSSIVDVILHGPRRSVTNDIVSGPVDADKLDYLLRDSYFAGVRYGVFDLDRIVEEAVPIGEGESMGFSEGAVWAIEQLLLAKHHMTTQVYGHKLRLITDAMVVRGVELAAEEDGSIRNLFAYDGSSEFLSSWKRLDDARLCALIAQSKSERARSMFERLAKRRLLKKGVSINLGRDVPDIRVRNKLMRLEGDAKKEVEEAISAALPDIDVKPWEVIINRRSLKSPTIKGSQLEIDPDTIYIVDSGGNVDSLAHRPEVMKIPSERQEMVDIYLPLPYVTRRERRQYIAKHWELLLHTLFEAV